MKLSVYSLQKILFQGDAKILTCKTAMGEITILDHHEIFIGVLRKGIMKVVDDAKKEHTFEVNGGFVEVKPGNEVRCIISSQ